jgi:tetratricopeptide (TPR) repeat protein
MTLSNHGSVGTSHPEIEQLAAYVDGALAAPDRASLETHLAACRDCRTIVADTAEALEHNPVTARERREPIAFPSRRRIKGAAFTLAAAAVVLLAVWTNRAGDSLEGSLRNLRSAASRQQSRISDGRLAGFPYAPPPAITRGADIRTAAPEVAVAAAAIETRARDQRTPAADAALGVAYTSVGAFDSAIDALQRAASADLSSAAYRSDLAAAYIARGRATGQLRDIERARDAAAEALSLDRGQPEACFNSALSQELIAQASNAPAADERWTRSISTWRACLTIEHDSRWRGEIDSHLRNAPK